MFDADSKLRQLAFFEELALLDESSDAWREASAGLVTLRLVDAWLEVGVGNAADDEWNFRSVFAAVDSINERSRFRSLLTSVLFAMREGRPSIRAVVPSLMAYGMALEYEAKLALAADVYRTLLAHLHPIEDSAACIDAQIRLGTSFRHLNLIGEAEHAYARAAEIGVTVNDLDGVLRARVGEASLARLRGNLPKAAEILDQTIARATDASLDAVRWRAVNERSGVAIQSGHYEFGIKMAYEAMVHIGSAMERDRILNNIASAFTELGVYSAARDAYLVLSATAQEQYMRWMATINLIDLSSLTGSETLFEQHRSALANSPLPPQLATGYQLVLGFGYQRFGHPERASSYLQSALAMALEHGLNQMALDAEKALETLKAPTPPQRVQNDASLDVREVAEAIKELRTSVPA